MYVFVCSYVLLNSALTAWFDTKSVGDVASDA